MGQAIASRSLEQKHSILTVDSRVTARRFLQFPYFHYHEHKNWVPQLQLEQRLMFSKRFNPFFEHGSIQRFIAVDSTGKVVGRIAAIKNELHLKNHKDGTGFFGFFESIDDFNVSSLLLDSAAEWLREYGLSRMRGPVNPSMNEVAGLLVDGFAYRPSIFMPYNPPYYESLLLESGATRSMTLWTFFSHRNIVDLEFIRQRAETVLARYPDIHFEQGNFKSFQRQADTILNIYNESWKNNWGHVPMTRKEFKRLSALFRYFLKPELVLFAVHKGKIVGFSVALPNLNEILSHMKNGKLLPTGILHALLRLKYGGIRSTRLLLGGFLPEYWASGIEAALALKGLESGLSTDFESCELGWVLDTNKIVLNSLEAVGLKRDKQYALFDRKL